MRDNVLTEGVAGLVSSPWMNLKLKIESMEFAENFNNGHERKRERKDSLKIFCLSKRRNEAVIN